MYIHIVGKRQKYKVPSQSLAQTEGTSSCSSNSTISSGSESDSDSSSDCSLYIPDHLVQVCSIPFVVVNLHYSLNVY